MASIRGGVPPVKCSAHSKRTGKQCARYAKPGTFCCASHGTNSPNTIAKAERVMSIAQIMGEERRPVGEVMLDSVAVVDKLMRDAVMAGEGKPTAEQVERVIEIARLANHMSYVAVKAGATAALVRERECSLALTTSIAANAVVAVIDALVDHLIALGIDQRHAFELRTWALEAASCRAEDREMPPLPPVPVTSVVVADVDSNDDHADGVVVRDEDDQHDEHAGQHRDVQPSRLRVVVDDQPAADSAADKAPAPST